ncbi:MAG TPA: pyridoxamine 5'-phosphate oxidase [Lachnospiraceae bacterium]|nr:pyridoxamine 5'-phosphate oxidase [Lachnospiraceae bacterium]
MTNTEKVWKYLNNTQIFYVTAVDGDQPKGRPFSFEMTVNDRIYSGVGTFKDCLRQPGKNPKIEIVAGDGKGFIRYYGKAVFDNNPDLFQKACAKADYPPKMYNKKTGHKLQMFYIVEATADIRSLVGIQESLKMQLCPQFENSQKEPGSALFFKAKSVLFFLPGKTEIESPLAV